MAARALAKKKPSSKKSAPATVLKKVRELRFALPEATEKEAWGCPTFRVKGKQFAMMLNNHHGDGRLALWIKSTFEEQQTLAGADPERFFVPPYVGTQGWVGVRLDRDLGWDTVDELLRDAWRLAAPTLRLM